MSEQPQEGYRKRFGIVIGAVVVLSALVLGGLLFFTGEDSSEEPDSRIMLTSEEQREAQGVVEDFLYDVGVFGYNIDELNGDNIYQVMRLNREGDTNALKMYASFRHETYLEARNTYIVSGAPLYYPTSDVYEWSVSLETENVFRYDINNIETTIPDTAQLTFLQGEDRKSIVVPVTVDTEQTKINEGVTDASWDGTHPVYKRTIPNVSAEVVLVQIDTEWKIYNLRNESHPYLFATWKDAEPENERFAINDGFSHDATLEPTEPFDIEKWAEGQYPTGGE